MVATTLISNTLSFGSRMLQSNARVLVPGRVWTAAAGTVVGVASSMAAGVVSSVVNSTTEAGTPEPEPATVPNEGFTMGGTVANVVLSVAMTGLGVPPMTNFLVSSGASYLMGRM